MPTQLSLSAYGLLNTSFKGVMVALLLVGITSTVHANTAGSNSVESNHAQYQVASRAAQAPLMDIYTNEQRLVAVGARGHILYSDDQGQNWALAQSTTEATLTSVHFVDQNTGWAAGHEGVIVKTLDGGETWFPILRGDQANDLAVSSIENALSQGLIADKDAVNFMLDDARLFAEEGATRPFLDIWFKDRQTGFAVGAYGMIFKTEDGGDHWRSLLLNINNPNLLHFNSIASIGDQLYLAGEAGTLFISSDEGESWQSLDSPYDGSFYGVVSLGEKQGQTQRSVLAYGLRGHVYVQHSSQSHWQKLELPINASLFGAFQQPTGGVILLGEGGSLIQISATGEIQQVRKAPSKASLLAAVAVGHDQLAVVGIRGVELIEVH